MKKAPKELSERILKKIEALSEMPIIPDTKVIHGFKEKMYRVRVGDYRILYAVDYQDAKLDIVKIDKRDSVYL
ncbi:type II toxin-antitoxin system RelE/ParE family toxin [Candidatus Woesearchaeota archaeon]|nr:type II toxin-antitoxin system RelE/ParE family toxin [Candidatus Woesearchaeota archaeon]